MTPLSRPRRLLHFLLLGCLLFTVDAIASHWVAEETVDEITVTPSRVEALRRDFTRRAGSLPNRRELAALIREDVDREILFREALRHGLCRSDPVIRHRLIRNMRFAETKAPAGSDALDAALALGMERSDPVVRRILVQRASQLLATSANSEDPGPAELAAYLESHAPDFLQPARYRFAQVFLSADRRGAGLEGDAARLLVELRSQKRAPHEIEGLGDPFPLPQQLGPLSPREIAKQLGPGFAREIERTGTGRWTGPVASVYGRHLVWVLEVTPQVLPSPDELRRRLTRALREERRSQALKAGLEWLRRRYEVRASCGAACAQAPATAAIAATFRSELAP